MPDMFFLVVNNGSSSLKAALFDAQLRRRLSFIAERLGSPGATLHCHDGQGSRALAMSGSDHRAAIAGLLAALGELEGGSIQGIGHRVVHGGERFADAAIVDAGVLEAIRQCVPLAPLHNPANILGIELLWEAMPGVAQVAVFDTAFHQSLAPEAFHYGLPQRFYRDFGVRRYGFHGTSHRYVSREAAVLLGLTDGDWGVVTAHLGNGCSLAAVENGLSVETSMGFTPLEGLVMGTRCGDIDPSLHAYLCARTGMDLAALTHTLNHESGLLGISELSNDMRRLWDAAAAGHAGASLAIEVFCHRVAKQVGAMMACLRRCDALVFTGGMGENAVGVRAGILRRLGGLGWQVDDSANDAHGRHTGGHIAFPGGRPALVINTDEERVIAEDTRRLLR